MARRTEELNCIKVLSGPKVGCIFAFPTGVSVFHHQRRNLMDPNPTLLLFSKAVLCLVAVEKLI